MAHDPVCKMEVKEGDAQYTSAQQGTSYYFCSADCKREFDAQPDKYMASGAATGSGAGLGTKAEQTYRKFKESPTYQKAMERSEEFKGKARERTKSLIDKQRGSASETLSNVAAALHQTARQLESQQQGAVARYADRAAQSVDRLSGYLTQKDADQLINDAERLVRRRPGLFLGGAFAAGFILARFLKSGGMRHARSEYSSQTGL